MPGLGATTGTGMPGLVVTTVGMPGLTGAGMPGRGATVTGIPGLVATTGLGATVAVGVGLAATGL